MLKNKKKCIYRQYAFASIFLQATRICVSSRVCVSTQLRMCERVYIYAHREHRHYVCTQSFN